MARKSLKKVEKIKEDGSMKLFPCLFRLNNSSGNSTKRSKPKIIYLLLFSLISSCFVFAPHLFYFPYPSALFLIGTILQSCTTSISLPSFFCCCCCPKLLSLHIFLQILPSKRLKTGFPKTIQNLPNRRKMVST